jgi:glycosyltransferase involved in cell wall biosynthesis
MTGETQRTHESAESKNRFTSASIIIPTYNRKALLLKCLEAAARLETDSLPYEILVVDDGGSDGTERAVNEFTQASPVPLRYLRQQNRGPAAARNLGAGAARGDIIAFLDDDCVPDKNWLREIVKGFSGENIAGVGGRTVSPHADSRISRYCEERKIIGAPIMVKGEVAFLITSNAAFRSDVFRRSGGFSPIYLKPGGEDVEICLRLLTEGHRFAYVPEAIVHHYHKQNFDALCKTFVNYGIGCSGTAFLHSDDPVKHPLLSESCPDIYVFSPVGYTKFFIRKEVLYLVRHSGSNAYHFYGLRHSILDAVAFTVCDAAIRFSHLYGFWKGYFHYRKMRREPDGGKVGT